MSRLKSIEELDRLRQQAQRDIHMRLETGTRITVGLGTCGIAAGARETMQAILSELQRLQIEAHVTTVGCIGMCASEPLVDITQANGSRITYGKVKADMVPRLLQEHLIHGRIVEEWVVGRMTA